MIVVLAKRIIYGVLIRETIDFNKACKSDEYLDIKICLCQKLLLVKLVLTCWDKISNTTETSVDDKNV